MRKFEEAKADVLAAGKRIKARELAEAAAKDLKKKVADKGIKDLATLRDFAAENKVPLIELDPLAKVKMHPGFAPGMPAMYLPGSIPPDKVEFANDEMIKQLLEMLDKPKGETTIVSDAPKSKFFVAVLLEIINVDDSVFEQVFIKAADGTRDQNLDGFERTRRLESRRP